MRGEIWAYGLRNPARLTWDFDPANPRDNHLIANVIGLYTWETVVIIHKGANYGYSLREGNQKLDTTNHTTDLPADDKIPVLLNATETDGMVTPTYPVIQYRACEGRRRRGFAAATCIAARRSRRCAANTFSAIFRPATSGTPITKRCWPPTTAIRKRWPRCIR